MAKAPTINDVYRAFAEIFAGEAGQIVLDELEAQFDQPAYKVGGTATDAIWRDGQRSVLLHINALVEKGLELRRRGNGRSTNNAPDGDAGTEDPRD